MSGDIIKIIFNLPICPKSFGDAEFLAEASRVVIMEEKQIEGTGSRRRYFKFVLGFLGMLAGVFILYALVSWGIERYRIYTGQKKVQELADIMNQSEKEARARAMADTYGGKTPQETLRMYIEAVEKGDYELASKYFIEGEREGELQGFKGATQDFIKNYVNLIRATEGSYDSDKKYYTAYKPIGIRMVLYPNGIWKIIEI